MPTKKIENKKIKKFFPKGGTEDAEKAQAAVTANAIKVDNDVNKNVEDDKASEKLLEAIKKDNRFLKDIKAGKNFETVRYSKQIAEKFGKSFSIHIAPMTYVFQIKMGTTVHKEHLDHVYAVFDQDIRAKGDEIKATTLEALEAEVQTQTQNIMEIV